MPKTLLLICLVLAELLLLGVGVNAAPPSAPVQIRTKELKMTGVAQSPPRTDPRARQPAPVQITTKPLTVTGTRN